ncbi:MAG: LacI family transcriptional regulator [Lachnospiraceae bacterium]|nr:LacI family transcriptional regulator [Lachnospiraceae bacterium]
MTTIKDIAEYTGVSATTVSNVIHGRKNRVSDETVRRIEEAIDKLGYVPNLFARSLVSSSSKVVALINFIPTEADAFFVDESFQMSFLSTIETILRKNGYFLMYRRVENIEDLKFFLMNWNVDGFFVSGTCDPEFVDEMRSVKTPVVFIDSYVEGDFTDVGHDDSEGGYLATTHLIERGHKRIAFTAPTVQDGRYMEQRYIGYRNALAAAGMEADKNLVFESGVDIDSCRNTAEKILSTGDVTGVVATTDIMAAGLMAAFIDMGKSIPDDISIIGFDDTPLSRMLTPRLTTIRQDMRQKAQVATEYMVDIMNQAHGGIVINSKDFARRINDQGIKMTTRANRIILPVELVVRDSVKDIK